MMTHVTSLPHEIWLQISSYLEAHEIINAFSHLNSFFDDLLLSDYLRVHLRVRKDECNWDLPPEFEENFRLQSIRSIKATHRSPNRAVRFLRWNWTGLIHLESLSIILRKDTVDQWINHLCDALQNLPSLKALRIRSYVQRLPSTHLKLFQVIFGPRLSLTRCEILMPIRNFDLDRFELIGGSTIRYLTIRDIWWSNLLPFLSATPNLVVLEANVVDISPAPTSIVHPSLRELILCLPQTSSIFLQETRSMAPYLECLKIRGNFSLIDEELCCEKFWKNLLNGIRSYHIELNYFTSYSDETERYEKLYAPFIENGWMKRPYNKVWFVLDILFQSK